MSEKQHLPCPDVQGCGSNDAWGYNTETNLGYCFSCELKTWVYKGQLLGKRGKRGEQMELDTQVSSTALVEDFGEAQGGYTPKGIKEPQEKGSYEGLRGITSKTMEKFGVKTEGDKQHYVYPSGGIKTRYLKEKSFSASNLKSDELFGMNLFPVNSSKIVTITEGELDCLSAWQMLSVGSTYVNPVVSLPSATPSGKLWENCKGWLDSFDKIVLSVDKDAAGDRVAEKVSQIFAGKVYRMEHGSYKDANDFLMSGDAKAFKSAWWGAKKIKPDSILCTSEDFLDLYENTPDFEFCPTGIPQLDEKILGLNKGYYTVIVAPTGLGKTEFMRYLEYQVLTRSNYKFAYMHLEESQLRSTLGMVSYKLGDNLTRKDLINEKGRDEDVKQALFDLGATDRMHQFSLGTDEDHNDLIDRIKYLVAAMDVDFVFFEPIQDIVDGDMKDKESKLSDLSSKLSRLASEVNVGIITIAHANEDGDTMYCKMIGKKAAFEITLERDQTAETHEERNRTYIHVGRKNRVGGGNGPAGALDFDLDSYTLKVVEGPKEPKTDNKGDF